nr:MAG TPA: hypothetical protein [Caudoviricetes sp.]
MGRIVSIGNRPNFCYTGGKCRCCLSQLPDNLY